MKTSFVAVCCLLLAGCADDAENTQDKAETQIRTFKDCDQCPEMVVIPAGSFEMGARDHDPHAYKKAELPRVQIQIAKPFALGKFEVTRDQYQTCVDAGGCAFSPVHMPWEQPSSGWLDFPIVFVSREDALQYAAWLSKVTGHRYSLPSEAEWEYAARGGTSTIYWWGDDLGSMNAHCVECGGGHPFLEDHKAPKRVGSFPPNPFGLHDMVGNVREHVLDCFTYITDLPSNSSAYTTDDCRSHSLRGSSYDEVASFRPTRLSARSGAKIMRRERSYGFRVKREIDPAEAD